MIAGIDEAGRGPVIGPMVMAIVACNDQESLRQLGVADSKLLSPERREHLDVLIRDQFAYELIVVQPPEIDAAVMGKSGGDNLNRLEARTSALLIHRLAKRSPIREVYIDSPTKSVEKYEAVVREYLRKLDPSTDKIILRCEIKADANHPVAGAASILAKVARDASIRDLETAHGPMGSGYPSDPATQRFLQANWKEGHVFFRKSWESFRRLSSGGQSSLASFSTPSKVHASTVADFEQLRAYGFSFVPPTNQYEVVRMKSGDGVAIIRYTTGKTLVQGPDAPATLAKKLLSKMKLD